MKTKEFIKRVKELGFEVGINGGTACVLKNDYTTIMRVEVDKTFVADCFYLSNKSLEEEIREKLFDLLVEYAKTPIEDREEEKKFYLRHRYLRSTSGNILYFSIYIEYGFSILTYRRHSSETKQQFTLKEIEEIKEEFDTDLADFVLVEVEE